MKPNLIFVFGSNLAGIHGKGAALFAAQNYGAIKGIGEGIQNSSYAIPTKDKSLRPLGLNSIKEHVDKFIKYALDNPNFRFVLTPIGTGLAGYPHDKIAPLFKDFPPNVIISGIWQSYYNFPYRLLIAGGRDFADRDRMAYRIKIARSKLGDNIELVCGMAKGADRLAYEYFLTLGNAIYEFPAEWDRLGKKAGIIRNRIMANVCTHVLLFWDGKSSGTLNMRAIAIKENMPLVVEYY